LALFKEQLKVRDCIINTPRYHDKNWRIWIWKKRYRDTTVTLLFNSHF